MVERFEEGKKYVFDLDSYLQSCDRWGIKVEHPYISLASFWVNQCNQKEVTVINEFDGLIAIPDQKWDEETGKMIDSVTEYDMSPAWCKEVE